MKHLRAITRKPAAAEGEVDLLETLILMGLQFFFSDWDNYSAVSSNLRKYYSKT